MSTFMTRAGIAGALALAAYAGPTYSHISLETQQAAVSGYYKAVLRVPHGCQGSATTAIQVSIPEGVINVKPMPKPGWVLQTQTGTYDNTYTLHGKAVKSGVKQIVWKQGSLPDDQYDEFVFMTYLSPTLKAGTHVYFPVAQQCESGSAKWVDIPMGHHHGGGHGSSFPAPGLELMPAKPTE